MRVRYRCTSALPAGVAAILVPGERETVIQINAAAAPGDIAEALDEIVGQKWVQQDWLHIGDAFSGLRSVG